MHRNKKKKTHWNVAFICTVSTVQTQTLPLCRSVCDQNIKTETILLGIFLILFTVRLQEFILDFADHKIGALVRLREVPSVMLERRNCRDHSLVSANMRCSLTRGVR